MQKTCFKCGLTLPLEKFHRHAGMRDGRLNKCGPCVVQAVSEWRAKHPGVRQEQRRKDRERKGFKSRAQYDADRAANKMGRKAIALKYTHKRRAQKQNLPVWDAEFDALVIHEALDLVRLRTEHVGGAWDIDHIVPLNSRSASGLHNGFNLQVVPRSWNKRKSNRHMGVWSPDL